eukprot:Gregarina_sp_Poly_1__3911@NODE_2170_length_2564_cov_79_219864_g1399_i0_p4_GENE_NODE_2170_length_2564_cov_79_219864_g1399_i0NODE_2170_length_2564_cov_79_219864_g1399_i0_p4_ORF_typecomplete_len104_score18_62Robl_LC7/PF03259_17/1_2e16LAMTOR5/PF16672_5/0_012DUF2023/PF09633_10/0_083_NODE_2170_length_2564_cov_79_219864_g1399_i022042515
MFKDSLDRINRLRKLPGVQGVVVATRNGRAIHTTMQATETKTAAAVAAECFQGVEKYVERFDKEDEVKFVRIKTHRKSYMLSKEGDYVLILIAEDQVNEPTGG